MMTRPTLLLAAVSALQAILIGGFPSSLFADSKPAETGKVTFRPVDDQKETAERYRLNEYEFSYELRPLKELPVSGIDVFTLTFPSPVRSAHPANNTVHAEYYRPRSKGPFAGVIVLDILGGDQKVSRNMSRMLSQNGIACLFVQMAYYGPRRPKDQDVRLLSPDIDHTMEAIRQTVLDNRCAAAWLESRSEIDPKRLGIVGTSLGSFMGALTAAAEPRLHKTALLLGGGGLVDAYWEHPLARPYLQGLQKIGIDKETWKKAIAPADPITYAGSLAKRDLLMIAAERDDVVPPAAAKALWEATGKQKILWVNSTHVGAVVYLFDAADRLVRHFNGK